MRPIRAVQIPFAISALAFAVNTSAQGMLEEVLVTAAKREQTLQEVPIAVSVVTSETIEQAQVLDIKDLQTLVPSLRVSQLQQSGATDFIIRGFGNGSNNFGVEPSVGVVIDGVYRSRVGSALADLPKLERIEVLRGPQSTLFGRNASAGVISVVTAKPDMDEMSGSVGATIGNYSQTIVRGDITGPISDTLGFSLFASNNERDGYFDNLETGEQLNELDRWNFRGQLLWQPSDEAEVRLIVDAEEIDERCCGVASVLDGPTGAAIRAIGGNLTANERFAYANFYDYDPSNEIANRGISLQFDYDFDSFMFSSITANRTLDSFSSGDVDFTSAELVLPEMGDFRDTSIETFTQEFRLTSQLDGPLQWNAGLFYFNEDVDIVETFGLGPRFRDFINLGIGAATGLPDGLGLAEGILNTLGVPIPIGSSYAPGVGNQSENYTLQDETYSVYAQFDYNLTDSLVLTAGLNYTESEKEATINVVNNNLLAALPTSVIAGQIPPVTPDLILAAQLIGALPQNLPPTVALPNSVEDNVTNDDEITYTLRLAYDVNANVNVYAGVSTGFKASAWNLSQDSGPVPADQAALIAAGDPALPNVGFGPGIANYPGSSFGSAPLPASRFAGPESSTVYEIGLKGEWDTVAVNLAIFDQEIEGFQQNAFIGTGFVLANAGSQSTEGVEAEITWAPTDSLRIGFAATWLDPIFDDFQGGIGAGFVPQDLTGVRPAGIPDLSTNTNITYNFQVGGIDAYARLEHLYEDEVQAIQAVPEVTREINTFNASAGLTFTNGVDLNFWARNLNNDEYLITIFPSVAQAGSLSGYPTQPRTYGVTMRYSF